MNKNEAALAELKAMVAKVEKMINTPQKSKEVIDDCYVLTPEEMQQVLNRVYNQAFEDIFDVLEQVRWSDVVEFEMEGNYVNVEDVDLVSVRDEVRETFESGNEANYYTDERQVADVISSIIE